MIKIRLVDVEFQGSVSAAIRDYCERSYLMASGPIGPTFETSGPGSGWSRQFGPDDYAARALDLSFGAAYYVDSDSGRFQSYDSPGEWSDESCVELICPTLEEAAHCPEAFANMVEVLDVHEDLTDREEWGKLKDTIHRLSAALG